MTTPTTISDQRLVEFKADIVKDLQMAITKVQLDMLDDILELQSIDSSGEYSTLSAGIALHQEAIEKLSTTKEDRKARASHGLDIDAAKFRQTQMDQARKRLYIAINNSAEQIDAVSRKISRVVSFSPSDIPTLPYIEIDGTRYEAENNHVKKNKKGEKVLYVVQGTKHDKDNPTKKA